MAITVYGYSNAPKNVMEKLIDWTSDTIKVALCTSSYTPNQDTHEFFDDITNEHAATGGYSAGGETLGTKTNTQSGNVVTLDAADVTWSASTITNAYYAIVYMSTGTASTSPLICWYDFGENKSSSSSDFTISWNASGLITFTVPDA